MTTKARYIISAEISGMSVPYGTPFESLPMQGQPIMVTLDDNSTTFLEVIWEEGEYDPYLPGVVRIEGEIQLTGSISNPYNIKGYFDINVARNPSPERVITGLALEYRITVVYDTPFENLPLPSTVYVALEGGRAIDLGVIWDDTGYSPTTLGTVTLSGELQLIEGIVNPDEIKAEILVTVLDDGQEIPERTITQIAVARHETVLWGTPYSSLRVPDGIYVVLNDGSMERLSVVWDEFGYQPEESGDQTIYGELQMILGVTNPLGVVAQYMVTVLPPKTIEEVYKTGSGVEYGMPYHAIEMPQEVAVVLNTEESILLGVTWDGSDYTHKPPFVSGPLIFDLDILFKRAQSMSELEQRTIPQVPGEEGRHYGVITNDHASFFFQRVELTAADIYRVLSAYIGGYVFNRIPNQAIQTITGEIILIYGVTNPNGLVAEHNIAMQSDPYRALWESLQYTNPDPVITESKAAVLRTHIENHIVEDFLFHFFSMIPQRKDISQRYLFMATESRKSIKRALFMGLQANKTYRAY